MSALSRFLPYLSLLMTSVAVAEEQQIDAGLVFTSDEAPHYGEYSGLQDDGAHFVGALDLSGSLDGLGIDRGGWRLTGRNLGLDTYDATLTGGVQGAYELTVTANGIQQYKRDDGRTPYLLSDELLGLPATWVTGPSTADMDLSNATTRSFDQKLKRDQLRIEGSYFFGERWKAQLSFEHEEKQGNRTTGGAIYFDASTAFSALLPLPVDTRTSDLLASLTYAGGALSSTSSFLYTDFSNDNQSLRWDNAFTDIGDPRVDFPGGQGGLSQAPDHDRLQLRTTGSYLPQRRMLSGLSLQWDGAYDRVEQNETFQPYTVNPELLVTNPLPRNDLGGKLETVSVDLRANYRPSWRPLRKLRLRSSYRYDDRDQDRSRDPYDYVRGDGGDQPDGILSIFANAYDNQREGFDVAGDYRLKWWRSKLTLEYDYEQVERKNAAVDETQTDTYSAILRASPLNDVTSRVSWSYADRRASRYHWDESFFTRRTTDFINQTPDNQRFDNHPALSQYHLANSETDAVRFDLGYTGFSDFYLGADVQWRDINYDQSEFGLIETESWFYNLDLQYSPRDEVSAFAYFSYSTYKPQSAGRSFAGGAEKVANATVPPLPQGSDPSRNWSTDVKDEAYSVGGGVSWRYSERLGLDAEYVYVGTRSKTDFGSGGAVDLDTTSLPDAKSRLHSLTLQASYDWRDNTKLLLRYQYYYYKEDDWALDDTDFDTLSNVLLLGERPDDEHVNVIGISLRYGF